MKSNLKADLYVKTAQYQKYKKPLKRLDFFNARAHIISREKIISRYQHVCTRRYCKWRGLGVYTTVNLNVYIKSLTLTLGLYRLNLIKRYGHKLLSAKTGLHRHYKHHITKRQKVKYLLCGCCGFYCDAGLTTKLAYLF